MTPAQFKAARKKLGLTIQALAGRLKLDARTVRRFEQPKAQSGHRPVPGPVEVLMRLWTTATTKATPDAR